MKYTDKLGLPIWNEPKTDVIDIQEFNEGMQAVDDIVIHILNQIDDLVIGDTQIDLNGYVKEEVFRKYAKIIANKADKEEVETIKSLNINIGDYEIDNTGNTDVTSKIQEIFNYVRDNGGGKITFPTGEYYIRNYIDVYSNTYVFFEDGCIITKKGGLGSQTTFAINRKADEQEYGYTAENITFDGGTFDGCKLGLGIVVQKVKNLTFKNMKFIDCMVDSHILDIQGVNNCLVENCIFEGRYPSSPDRIYAECIQYDISSKPGAPSFSGADGTTSYGIIVRNCTFKPRSEERRVGKECRSRWSPYH